MDPVTRTLPPPVTTSRDIFTGLRNIDALVFIANRNYEELRSRLVVLVAQVTDLRTKLTEMAESPSSELETQIRDLVTTPTDFLWRIQPSEPIPTSVCKNKRVVLGFHLEDVGEGRLPIDEEITLHMQVLNSSKSRIISTSLGGEPMLSEGVGKAVYSTAMKCHTVQITFRLNEVSSHFEGGCVALLFQALCPGNMDLQQLIKPYVVEGLVIRAKEITCRKDRSKRRRQRHPSSS